MKKLAKSDIKIIYLYSIDKNSKMEILNDEIIICQSQIYDIHSIPAKIQRVLFRSGS